MIKVTELHGQNRHINADLIEFIETAPETQIVMRDGRRIFVRETPETIVDLVIAYKQKCHYAPPPAGPAHGAADVESDNGN